MITGPDAASSAVRPTRSTHSGADNDGTFAGVPNRASKHGAPPGGSTTTPAPPPPAPTFPSTPGTVNVVGLGDSYSSGVSLDDAKGSCARSHKAFPYEFSVANETMKRKLVACSGDKASQILAGKHGQLAALSTRTDVVTLTAGGDDLGFASVLRQCLKTSCDNRVKDIDANLPSLLDDPLNKLYSAISARVTAATKVVVLGYPHLFPDNPDGEGYKCRNFILPRIRANEQKLLNKTADDVDRLISQIAAQHGFTYLSTIPIFKGHDVCSGDHRYLNAIIALHREQSFHPTAAGQRAEGSAITAVLG